MYVLALRRYYDKVIKLQCMFNLPTSEHIKWYSKKDHIVHQRVKLMESREHLHFNIYLNRINRKICNKDKKIKKV